MSGWGGARAGAGRPAKPLIEHVREGTFRAGRKYHRKLLGEDDSLLELQVLEEDRNFETFMRLADVQRTYGWRGRKETRDGCCIWRRFSSGTPRRHPPSRKQSRPTTPAQATLPLVNRNRGLR